MSSFVIAVGIDISKARLDIAVRPGGESWSVANDDVGLAELASRLKELGPEHIVLEASGGLEVPVTIALALAGLPVSVVNPRQTRDFAKAMGILAKTDSLDADVLARFGQAVRPVPRALPDEQTRQLEALVARRRQLSDMITAEGNRLRVAPLTVRERIAKHITWLSEEMRDVDRNLRDTIRGSPMWREKDCLLYTSPSPRD